LVFANIVERKDDVVRLLSLAEFDI